MKIFREHSAYFLPYAILVLIGLAFNLSYSQKDIFFTINRLYNQPLDVFMFYFTGVGNGLINVLIALLLAFRNVRTTLSLLLSFALTGIVVQLLKKLVFSDHIRPWKAWQDTGNIRLVPDFVPYGNNSFPSGHTATAFCMFGLLVLILRLKRWEPAMLAGGVLVAWSRIYLSQHVLLDVWAGSLLGTIVSIAVYYYFYMKIPARQWLDRPIHKIRAS